MDEVHSATNAGANANFSAVILYAASGGAHILLILFCGLFLFLRMKAEQPHFELKRAIFSMLLSFAIISVIVTFACYLDLRVVHQSYHSTVLPMHGDPRFGGLFQPRVFPLIQFGIEPFALYPFSLVLLGIGFSVIVCYWAAHEAGSLIRKGESLQKKDISSLKKRFAQFVSLLSIVFTSSVISTIAFLRVGRDWIAPGALRESYVQNAYSMSIFWSVCYTVIILGIILIPLFFVGQATLPIRRQAKFSGDRDSLYAQLYEAFSYPYLSKIGAATLMPILVSSVAAAIGG